MVSVVVLQKNSPYDEVSEFISRQEKRHLSTHRNQTLGIYPEEASIPPFWKITQQLKTEEN